MLIIINALLIDLLKFVILRNVFLLFGVIVECFLGKGQCIIARIQRPFFYSLFYVDIKKLTIVY